MYSILLWYLIVFVIGLLAFPITYRLLAALPDRGYIVSRIFGLLVWGYGYWLLGSLGLLRNDANSILFMFAVMGVLAVLALRSIDLAALRSWWGAQRGVVVITEIVFLITFLGWVVVRAANAEIVATEKPMELAFLNAILRSPTFPPHDPWLSGYAISYYYFGYVIVAMLSMMTATPAGIGFNLGISLIFALSALGALAVVYNLLAIAAGSRSGDWQGQRRADRAAAGRRQATKNALLAVFGPVMVLLVSNAEAFLELLHGLGLFWRAGPDGNLVGRFWEWLAIKDLNNPPAIDASWWPDRHWWWWRASRVVGDINFNGDPIEVIDEFPFFSFLLGDLHPHVLAIPFAFLAMCLALNLYLGGAQGWVGPSDLRLRISPVYLATAMWALGGLAFLNTWDFPIYVALFAAAYSLNRIQARGWNRTRVYEFVVLGLVLGIGGLVLYLPFYIGFSSQAAGILPNLINPTRGAHLWVMFGPLLVLLFAFLGYKLRRTGAASALRKALVLSVALILALWFVSLVLAGVIAILPEGQAAISALGAPNGAALLAESFARRFAAAGGLLTLLALLVLSVTLLLRLVPAVAPVEKSNPGAKSERMAATADPRQQSEVFSLLLILIGTLLVLAPEFLYLRDQFGTRMNTVFKFYYQSWLLWGVAAAFGTVTLLRRWRSSGGKVYTGVVIVVLAIGLIYPLLGVVNRTNSFNPTSGWTLDGTRHPSYLTEDDRLAVVWLQSAPVGTLVEAVGGSYTNYARISAHSGMPALLGWPGHVSQWRGGAEEMGSRQADIEQIYRGNSWDQTRDLLARYDIRYIYVGALERAAYGVNENKFRANLRPVFQSGQVTIYERP